MDFKQRSSNLWASVSGWASRSSDRQASRILGRSRDFVGYAKRNRQKGPSLEEWVGMLEVIGEPEFVIFGKLFPRPQPAELLRRLHERFVAAAAAGDAPLLLSQLERAWSIIETKVKARAEAPRPSLQRRLLWIDELRLEDPGEALRQLETSLESLLLEVCAAKNLDPDQLGELAYAVAQWADLQRAENLPAAIAGGALAVNMAERSGSRWAIAQSLWLAAVLVLELGHPELGLPFIDRAAGLFSLDHHFERLPELMVTQGILSLEAGFPDEGQDALRQALERLPMVERRWRHQALMHLAIAAQETGHHREALACLEELARNYPQPHPLQPQLQWRRTQSLLLCGDIAEGLAAFAQVTARHVENGDWGELAYALCDVAECLANQGQASEIPALTAAILALRNLRGPRRQLAALLEDFHAQAHLRPVALTDIWQIRARLEKITHRPSCQVPLLAEKK